jgi:hypothetical protein
VLHPGSNGANAPANPKRPTESMNERRVFMSPPELQRAANLPK